MTNAIERLKLMREKLANQGGGGKRGGDGAVFPFWNVKIGSSVGLRFLPDKNTDNPFMWVEKQTFKWTFPDPKNPQLSITVTLPCREMYDGPKSCKIVNELRPLYNTGNEKDAEAARPFWPKKVFIYQGFVRNSTIQEDTVPENPVRVFMINKSIHVKIKESILSNDPQTAFEISPDDFVRGRDFIVKKTKQGRYDNYDQSQWAFSETSLSEHELASIEKYGLWDLSTRLPRKPSEEAYEVMYQMFHAAQNGDPWDPAWEKHFKPRNAKAGGSDDSDEVDTVDTADTPAPSTPVDRLKAQAPATTAAAAPKPAASTTAPAISGSAGKESNKEILDKLKKLRDKAPSAA